MRTIAILATGMVASVFSALATPLEVPRDNPLALRYEMAVGADGKAASLRSIDQLPGDVDQRIQQRIRSLDFEPATVNGTAQPAATTLYLTLRTAVLPNGTAGYQIASLSTGPRRLANQTRENLPRKTEAGYMLVSYNRDGRVTQASLEESVSSAASPRFRKWALHLAKSFKFQPETVAGMAVPATVRMPLVFCAEAQCPNVETQAIEDGHQLAGDMEVQSVLKLKSPMTGNSI